jgi:hypothetical protein
MPSSPTRPDPAKVRSSTVLAAVAILLIAALAVVCWVLLVKLVDFRSQPTLQEHSDSVATTSVSAEPERTDEEKSYLQQIRDAGNFVAVGDEDDLIAAAHAWCDNRVPGMSPGNATLSRQIEAKYPVAGTIRGPLGWQPIATDILCPEMNR